MSRRRPVQRLALSVLFVLLAAVALVQLGGLGWAPDREHGAEGTSARAGVLYDRTFAVRPGGRLMVDLTSEDVIVRTTSDSRARVRVEGRGRDAEREFRRRRFSADTRGNELVVRTDPPRRGVSMGRTNARYTVTVEVPRRFSAALDLGSGDVEVGSLRGDLAVDVGSGDVSVSDVDGDRIALDTGSGDVTGRALRGEVAVETGSGDVRLDRVDGRLAVSTGSGDVEAGEVAGPSAVETGSGDVALRLRTAARTSVGTGSGDVTLRLPRAGFDVALSGGPVRIDRALDFDGRTDRRSASGRVNGGGPRIEVSTGSGDIRLRAR